MPLLNKRPWVKQNPPNHLRDVDKVFYCDITNEVFTNYEEYWDRLVLCNAMLWTCEVTGRPDLTYSEALHSEIKARRSLSDFPKVLRVPMLYAATLTRRGRYIDLNEDVFNFIRDRYFVGEPVEAIVKNHWYDCKVLKHIHPTKAEVEKYEREMAESDDDEDKEENKEAGVINGVTKMDDDDDDDIQVIKEVKKEDDEIMVVKEVIKNSPAKKVDDDGDDEYPPFATVKYEVIELDPWDYKERQVHTVSWEQIRRNKGVFTREKCKLFLKQCVFLSHSGVWTVKEKISGLYKIPDLKFTDIFTGDPPKFKHTPSKRVNITQANPKMKKEKKKREKKEAREGGSAAEKVKKKMGRPVLLSPEEKEAKKKLIKENKEHSREQLREAMKQQLLERKEERKEERKKEILVQREERRMILETVKEWQRAREDLDCDSLKDLPIPTPIRSNIPDQSFGKFLMILEFINAFYELLELRDVYPQGITFEMLEHALVEREVAGVLTDILQLLLGAIFTLQEQEDDEAEEDPGLAGSLESEGSVGSLTSAVRVANIAARWSQSHLGLPLQQVPLDALTLTEVLRLHLLAAGATNVANGRWRHLNRGGYKNTDDPGLQLRLDHPGLISGLVSTTVYELNVGEKLKILETLVGQILTYASLRDIIDDNIDKLREGRNKLRLHQVLQMRRDRDDKIARNQEKREKQQKIREKLLKEAEKKAAAVAAAAAGCAPLPVPAEAEEEEEEEEEVSEDEEEKAAREEKNKESRKLDYLRKEREIIQQLRSLAKGVSMNSLGLDRAYRRYWLFSALPGLYVELGEENPGFCRPMATRRRFCPVMNPEEPFPQPKPAIKELIHTRALANILGTTDDKGSSDKENDGASEGLGKLGGGAPLQALTPNATNANQSAATGSLPATKSPEKKPKAASGNTTKNTAGEGKIATPNKEATKESKTTIATTPKTAVTLTSGTPGKTPTDLKTIPSKALHQNTPNVKTQKGLQGDSENQASPSAATKTPQSSQESAVKSESESPAKSDFSFDFSLMEEEEGEVEEVFGMCTADGSTCKVHKRNPDTHKWFFFQQVEDLQSLKQGLTQRGIREKELVASLDENWTAIEASIKACPIYKLDPSLEPEVDKAVRKSQRNLVKKDCDPNLSYPPGTPIQEILKLTLRDMVLEFEERLFQGMLGSLKLEDRGAWRNEVDTLKFPKVGAISCGGKKRIAQFKIELGLESEEELKKEEEEEAEDSGVLEGGVDGGVVRELATVILQLARAVETKYMIPPLGDTDKLKKLREKAENKLRRQAKKDQEAEENSDSSSDSSDSDDRLKVSDSQLRTPLERWELSLMAATNYSQLCLHYSTLDNSISWSRSALNARCRVCRRSSDAEKMLLCDGCNKGTHIYCLKPKLKQIPSDDWFCEKCKPKEKPKSPRKNRQIYKEESEEDGEEGEEGEDNEEDEDETDEDDNEQESTTTSCCKCPSDVGRLLICDTCPRGFHPRCASVTKTPRGSWTCPYCCQAEKKRLAAKDSKAEATRKEASAARRRTNAKKEANAKREANAKKDVNTRKIARRKDPAKRKVGKKSPPSTPPSRNQQTAAAPPANKRKRQSDVAVESSNKKSKMENGEAGDSPPGGSPPGGGGRRSGRRSLVVEGRLFNCGALQTILEHLYKNPNAWPFLKPVSKKAAPDYYEVVRKPIDLRAIQDKLDSMKYTTDDQLIADVMLIFQNCQQYNHENSTEYECGVELSRSFLGKVKEMGLKVPVTKPHGGGRRSKK